MQLAQHGCGKAKKHSFNIVACAVQELGYMYTKFLRAKLMFLVLKAVNNSQVQAEKCNRHCL